MSASALAPSVVPQGTRNMPLFEAARWAGGPAICVAENLPAFASQAEHEEFLKKNGPSCHVHRVWQCAVCGFWHAKTSAPDPTGGSSGTGRGSK